MAMDKKTIASSDGLSLRMYRFIGPVSFNETREAYVPVRSMSNACCVRRRISEMKPGLRSRGLHVSSQDSRCLDPPAQPGIPARQVAPRSASIAAPFKPRSVSVTM